MDRSERVCYKTDGEYGYSAKFSPFAENRLAYVTCANYGIIGRGYLHHLEVRRSDDDQNHIVVHRLGRHEWPDGLFDVTWSETSPDVCVASGGDGTLQIWNVNPDAIQISGPLQVMKEHKKEVYNVEWCLIRSDDRFVSASWDQTIKIWCPARRDSIVTLEGHESVVYCATWSPHIVDCIASAAGDGSLRIWSLKCPKSERVRIAAHDSEILSCDWNRYDQNILATAATDGLVRVWDLRNPREATAELGGHRYAVRRVKFSPFSDSQLATVSYDFTTRLWMLDGSSRQSEATRIVRNHTEFVYGLDFNSHRSGQMVDCGFDQLLVIFDCQAVV